MTDYSDRLVLASASPRRAELLRQIGLVFDVIPADIDETRHTEESPIDFVVRIAREKAARGSELSGAAGRLVVAADTAVVLGELVLGKPAGQEDAAHLLAQLSGRAHEVLTAVAVTNGMRTDLRLSTTKVVMRDISEVEAIDYWRTGEPADKAGGYAIQGLGALFIERIEGSYSGVVGLPLYETAELLSGFGYLVKSAGSQAAPTRRDHL